MLNMKAKIKVEGYEFNVFKPEVCPFCEKGIDATIVSKFIISGLSGYVMYVAMKCPICGEVFLCKYLLGGSFNVSMFGELTLPYNQIIGGGVAKESFSDEINNISPTFVKIYNQAYEAEQIGLNEIDGMGFRKAFEFLIKDYAISINPSEKEAVISKSLSQCISVLFTEAEKEIFDKTGWIGNDATHYEKKHEKFNTSDLKKMIMICVSKVEAKIREINYIKAINK